VRYWAAGTPGLGERRSERLPTKRAAEDRAAEVRRALEGASGVVPPAGYTVGELARDWVEGAGPAWPAGTRKAYRRDLNCYILPAIGTWRTDALGTRALAAVVDRIVAAGLSASTLDGAVRTLTALGKWGALRQLLPSQPWGGQEHRQAVVATARRALRDGGARDLRLDQVPTWVDVLALADALEEQWPGRGSVFVRLLAVTGLRIGEALGLRADDIDAEKGTIRVERQADRLAPWPAMSDVKSRRRGQPAPRTAWAWAWAKPVLAEAVGERTGDAWLFPPDVEPYRGGGIWWTNRVTERLAGARESVGWVWTTHYLRHHFASVSLAPSPVGQGLDVEVVAELLGHASSTTTSAIYRHGVETVADAMARTTKGPGRRRKSR
jgi:integrase